MIGDGPQQMALIPSPFPVMKVSPDLARVWCEQWHYSGRLGNASIGCFGCYRESQLEAILAIGEGSNRYGVAEKFGLEAWRGNIEVSRVVVHPDASKNAASRSLAAVSRYLAACGYDWMYSYSDTEQDHHGGIYQAVNAVYVGTTARQWVNFQLNGSSVSKRVISARFGSTEWPKVRELAAARGEKLERVPWHPKHTYILVIAKNRSVRRQIRATLESRRLPFPKRGQEVIPTPYRNHRP